MRKWILATLFATLAAVAFAMPAEAGQKRAVCPATYTQEQAVKASCDLPTAVKRGQKVPTWKVAYCVVGKPGHYKKIDCQSPRAVHRAPTGNLAVCFVGTDEKVHWDYQREVHVGRPFINHKVGGRWQPDWQTPPPY